MAEITLEPTALSKVIPISLKINDTDANVVTRLATKKQFNTSDTDAWLSFALEGLESTSGEYDLTMVNVDEKPIGSVVHKTSLPFSAIPFYYKMDSGADLLTNEIRHAGRWIGQIVVRLANGDTTSRQFDFAISGHLLDGNEARLILIEDYNSLIATITASKDELTQYNIDYSTLLTDINAAKVAMDQAEIDRQATFDALVDSEMIAQNVATKLTEKEATFAPRMLSLESELAETQAEIDAAIGAMTVDSEVVVARSDYTTLGSRLNDLTAKKSDIKDKYYQINAPGDFTVFLPLGENEYGGYRFNRDATPTEDFIKMHENSVFEKSGGNQDVETTMNYGTISGGSMLATITNNHYTTKIGTKLTTLFTGYKVQLRFYTRYDGGLWNVKINGVDYGNISVWNASLVTGETKTYLIADELPNAEHTVVIEYLGADPAHPPTTSNGVTSATARGWISSNTTGDTTKYTFVTNKIEYVAIAMVKKFDLSEGFSNKEYAFEVRPAGTTDVSEWFPAHLGIATTFLQTDGVQDLIVDGNIVDIETSGLVTPFKDGQFVQYMYQKMSTDTENRAKIKLLITFTETVKQYFEMAFLLPTEIKNGYVFQMPMRPDYLSRIKTEKREIKLTDTVNLGVNEYYTDLTAREFVASSSFTGKKNYYLRCKMTNSSHGLDNLYLQHRVTTALQKLYPKVFNYTTIAAGAKVWFDGEYEVGKLKNADIIYG